MSNRNSNRLPSGFENKSLRIGVEASYAELKTRYATQVYSTVEAHPNGIVGSLDAIEAKWSIPIIYTSTTRRLAEEKAASWLNKHYAYWFLEQRGLGRLFKDGDL